MNVRKVKDRLLIYHEEEKYLVVLEIRQDYALLWTAYPIERQHTEEKLLKEYEDYKKARTPCDDPVTSFDNMVNEIMQRYERLV